MSGIQLIQGGVVYNAAGAPHPAPVTLDAGVLCFLSFVGSPVPVSYTWTLTRPTGSLSVLSSANSPGPTFTPDIGGGSYSIRLTDENLNQYAFDVVTPTSPGVPGDTGSGVANVKDFGAKGDLRDVSGVTIATGGTTFTGSGYTTDDIGKWQTLSRVGPLQGVGSTFTFNNATDVFTSENHNLLNGDSVQLANSGGALPSPGFSAATNYFVVSKATNTFQLSATSGGAAITSATTNGTGTNQWFGHAPLVALITNVSGTTVTIAVAATIGRANTWGTVGTDDQPSFQQALDFLFSLGGGTLLVPRSSGRYLHKHACQVPSNVSVVGEGWGVTCELIHGGWDVTQYADGTPTPDTQAYGLFTCYGVSRVRFSNLRFVGNRDVNTSVYNVYQYCGNGIHMNGGVLDISLDHILFEHFRASACFAFDTTGTNTGVHISETYYNDVTYNLPGDMFPPANACQISAANSMQTDCHYRDVGAGPAFTGSDSHVKGVHINNPIGGFVFCADRSGMDGNTASDVTVHMEINGNIAQNFSGFVTLPGGASPGFPNPTINNKAQFFNCTVQAKLTDGTAAAAKNIAFFSFSGADSVARGCSVDIDVKSSVNVTGAWTGFILATDQGSQEHEVTGNSFRIYQQHDTGGAATTWTGNIRGFLGAIANSTTLTVRSRGNKVLGLGGGQSAWLFGCSTFGPDAQVLKVYFRDEVTDGGGVAINNAGGLAAATIPWTYSCDSTVGNSTAGATPPTQFLAIPQTASGAEKPLFATDANNKLIAGLISNSHVAGAAAIANSKLALGGAVVTSATDQVQLTVRGNATQTTKLQEWQNSGTTVVASIANDGTSRFLSGTGTLAIGLYAAGYSALYLGGNTPSGSGYHITGNSAALELNAPSASGNLALKINQNTVLFIDANKRVNIGGGTTTPASELDVRSDADATVAYKARWFSVTQSANMYEVRDSSDVLLWCVDKSGKVRWSASANEQTTVGAAGAASAPPATPVKWLKIVDSAGTTLVIPAYNP